MENLILIKDGVVVNIIVTSTVEGFRAEAANYLADFDYNIAASEAPAEVGIGWSYDGNTFSAPV